MIPQFNSSLYAPVQRELEAVERFLEQTVQGENGFLADIPRLLQAGGKRLRPALLLMAAKTCGYSGDLSIRLAAAIELIHTASLIHDDVLDHDMLRRGIPTINAQLGDTSSVIIGDYLYSLVFTLLAQTGEMKVIRCVSDATNRMARGDLCQLRHKYCADVTETEYFSINADKTGSLISCACRIGAWCGTCQNGEADALADYGLNLGMAFQITDDLLDITGEEEKFGKIPGSDIREGKMTLPLIHAFLRADSADRRWIHALIGSKRVDPDSLRRVRDMVSRYDGIAYSLAKARDYTNTCKKNLAALDDSEARAALCQFADYVVARAG